MHGVQEAGPEPGLQAVSELPCNKLANVRRRAERASSAERIEEVVTCPASRHLMLMADALAAKRGYFMFDEDPQHCACAIYSVLESLWKARAEIKRLTSPASPNPAPEG